MANLTFPKNLLSDNSRYGNTYCQIQIIETYGGADSTDKNNTVKDTEGKPVESSITSEISSGTSIRNAIISSSKISSTIKLPMPLSISTNYGASYDDNFSYTEAFSGVIGGIGNVFTDVVSTGLGKRLGTATAGVDKIKSGLGFIGDAAKLAKNVGFAAAGLATNPHKELLFNGVKFREFKLKYKLIAKEKSESDEIKQIIEQFEYHMHPALDLGTLLYKYPSEFKITFKSGDYLFKIYKCVLTDYNVTYGGNNFVTFKDTNAPVEVEIELSFKETNVLTKDFISKNLR